MYLVEVKGNVIIKGGIQRCKETIIAEGKPLSQAQLEMLSDEYSPMSFNRKRRVVEGDLTLSEDCRYIPFATYFIHGDEVLDTRAKDGVSWVGDGTLASFEYWKESMKKMEELSSIEVPPAFARTFLNGLFVECFSAIELLLCNIAFSLIYSNQKYYDNAVLYWNKKENHAIRSKEELEFLFHDFFATRVYHQFDAINTIFKSVFRFSLPNYQELKRLLHRRNNIVHRHSMSNLDWMTATNASAEDVKSLLLCANCFGQKLEEIVSRPCLSRK